ncbi:MAG: signal peptidase I [Patescibacteria group bacterium]|nr:signal peptidase I [Patescibacteria group bacterium]
MKLPSDATETPSSKPRRPWLAGVLSLLGSGPLGQVYVGRLRRSLLLWLVGAGVSAVLLFTTISFPIQRLGLILLSLCVVAVPIYFAVDAFLLARRDRLPPAKRYQRWWVYALFFVLFCLGNNGAAHLLRSFVGEAFLVPTGGMSPTILAGERIVVDRLWYSRERVRRGDVVVFRSEGPGSPLFVQRLVGLPGDEIEIKSERVFINGEEWDDPRAVLTGPVPPFGEMVDYGPAKVPAECYFFLGDNRRRSKDSRMIGPIPIADVYGVARFIYWPRERTFPNPHDTTHYAIGPFHLDRLGMRLD